MNWTLIFRLSMLGLLMGVGTVFVIGPEIEPVFWLIFFALSAWRIAVEAPGRPFTHGVFTGLANCVWVTGAHVLWMERYLAWHPREAGMMASMPMPDSPRLMMVMMGPAIGLISGGVIGLLAMGATRLVRKPPAA